MSTAPQPVVFLAFANDRRANGAGYLRNLPEEARCLHQVLDQAQQRNLCEVLLHQNVTLDLILDVFQDVRYRNRIALFHYAGHANSDQLLFERRDGQPAPVDAGALAEFERNLIQERTQAGLQAARARGRKGGRPKSLNADKRALAVQLYEERKHTVKQICQRMGISKPTLYKYVNVHKTALNANAPAGPNRR